MKPGDLVYSITYGNFCILLEESKEPGPLVIDTFYELLPLGDNKGAFLWKQPKVNVQKLPRVKS